MNLRTIGQTAALLAATVVLAGCNITDQYHQEYDDLGKQIVADWKELPEVISADYEYRHGLDLGQFISAKAMLRAESISEPLKSRMVEIVQRDHWKGTSGGVSIDVVLNSSDDPHVEEGPNPGTVIYNQSLEVDFGSHPELAAELEKKYGPRPAGK